MSVNPLSERDMALADWGHEVVHQAVLVTYDIDRLKTVETIVETPLVACVGSQSQAVAEGTGGHHQRVDLELLLRDEDWPVVAPGAVRRFVVGGQRYEVIGGERSPAGGWRKVLLKLDPSPNPRATAL